MSASYQFPEGFLDDDLLNILHETYYNFSFDAEDNILMGGSFSLNAQGAIHRRVSDLDFCVSTKFYQKVVAYMRTNSSWWSEKAPTHTEATTVFYLRSSDSKVFLFKHDDFNSVPKMMVRIHGRPIRLFPAEATIKYKVDYLLSNRWIERNSNETVLKHFDDVIDYADSIGSKDKSLLEKIQLIEDVLRNHRRFQNLVKPKVVKSTNYQLDTQLLK